MQYNGPVILSPVNMEPGLEKWHIFHPKVADLLYLFILKNGNSSHKNATIKI